MVVITLIWFPISYFLLFDVPVKLKEKDKWTEMEDKTFYDRKDIVSVPDNKTVFSYVDE